MSRRRVRRTLGIVAVIAIVVLVTVGVAWARDAEDDLASNGLAPAAAPRGAIGPTRHRGPQGRVGQFVVHCGYNHSGPDDPIVHFGHAGRSHRHDFYGATGTDSDSTAAELAAQPTTCDKQADTAAYWHPTLYDDGEVVVPTSLVAYYRAAPGVGPGKVQAFPFGLALVAGDATATSPQPGDAAAWGCSASSTLSEQPPDCSRRSPLQLVLTFQDCWDGRHLDSVDHRSHVAYSAKGRCPASHPVHLPQLTVAVTFPIAGAGHELSLASGNVYSTHGDFLNAWDPAGLEREIASCIRRDVVCDLASNRTEDPLFQHD